MYHQKVEKKYAYDLDNFLHSNARKKSLPWLKQKSRYLKRCVEDLLLERLINFSNSKAIKEKIQFLWESLRYPEQNFKYLKSNNDKKRIRASLVFAAFQYVEAVSQLKILLKDSSDKVRWASAFALLQLKDETSIELVLESIRGDGAFDLIQLQPDLQSLGKEGVLSLEETLQNPESNIRILALGIMSQLKQKDFLLCVTPLIEDPILEVRMKAMKAIIDLSSTEKSGGKLVAPKKNTSSSRVEVQCKKFIENAIEAKFKTASWPELARVLQMIGSLKLKRFTPEIKELVTHLHPWVRYRALETLMELGLEGKRAVREILDENHHLVFPIFEDLDRAHHD